VPSKHVQKHDAHGQKHVQNQIRNMKKIMYRNMADFLIHYQHVSGDRKDMPM
jgi:hypothetical protein